MLRSVWLALVLSVASAPAWAQPAQPTRVAASVATVAQAQQTAKAAEQKLVTLSSQRVELRRRYDDQLAAIDRLKKQKASWRRDRELNKAQAEANDTAKRLTAVDNAIKLAQQTLGTARRAVVVAIDAELAAGAIGARAEQLAKLRAQVAPATPTPKKIVIPDTEVDLLADPEQLDAQAAALAAVERQLEAQRKGLDQQHKDLQLVAELRSAHERAGELSMRDDDQPHRGAQKPTSRTADELSPQAGNDSASGAGGAGGGGAGGGAGSGSGGAPPAGGDTSIGGESFGGDKHPVATFESNAAVALGEVVDKSTIDGLLRASRSGDPKQRAEAARLARDAVAKQIEQLRLKRAMIEQRAQKLRKH